MTKNSQSITVLDYEGKAVGKTYPKRAKSLVKKSRAAYVTDEIIRLNRCPTCDNTEDIMMDILNDNNVSMPENAAPDTAPANIIFLDPRKWSKNPDVEQQTNFNRFFMSTPFSNDMQEVLSIGTWGSNWCEITNGALALEKNTKYRFVFWLNGGENDRSNEVCQLHIIFTDNPAKISKVDWDNKYCFMLNRSYIKPLKKYKGWELYSIPFTTSDKQFVQLRFVAQFAPMAIAYADIPECYAELKDNIDPYADSRPQRHNIIFEDGWPTNTWYSTKALSGKNTPPQCGTENSSPDLESLAAMIAGFIDIDEIASSIADNINMDEIAENLNISKIKESIINSLKN